MVDGLVVQAIGYVGYERTFDADGLVKVSLVEGEFLILVYLPEAKDEFNRLQAAFTEVGRLVGEIVLAKNDKERGSKLLAELLTKKMEMQAETKLLRQLLVEAVKLIEKI